MGDLPYRIHEEEKPSAHRHFFSDSGPGSGHQVVGIYILRYFLSSLG